ncbi:MAG: hypothetical protein ABIZ36_13770 [Gemmatimonadaceae bacterium]
MEGKTKTEHEVLLAELRDTLTTRTEAAIESRIELRDAVCRFVDAEQTRGTPLATIINSVKEILAKAEEGATGATTELAQQLIDWCRLFHGERVLLAGEVS